MKHQTLAKPPKGFITCIRKQKNGTVKVYLRDEHPVTNLLLGMAKGLGLTPEQLFNQIVTDGIEGAQHEHGSRTAPTWWQVRR